LGQVIGHWKDLTEAQKLTQSQLIPGVIEEDIKRNNPVERVAVALALGKSIKWNREKTTLEGNVQNVDIGDKMTWMSNVEYTQMEVELKRKALPRLLDNFILDVYGTEQSYEGQALWEIKKGMMRALGDSIIYDDTTYGSPLQIDGLHAWAALNDTAAAADGLLDIDMGSAPLSVAKLRLMLGNMRIKPDYILCPVEIGLQIDAAYEEYGFAHLASGTAGTMTGFTRGINQIGEPVMYFQGIPIIRSDYLVAEQADTGRGTTLRAKYSSGTKVYSMFFIKSGDVFAGSPGVTLGFGNPEMKSKLYKVEYFDKLEDYDAKGLRLVTYTNLLVGSKWGLGRIHDITDANITV
jgi:hypothetical protein